MNVGVEEGTKTFLTLGEDLTADTSSVSYLASIDIIPR